MKNRFEKTNESAIIHGADSNGGIPRGRIMFLDSVAKSPIPDKDQASEDLSVLPDLYRTAGITGKNRKKIVDSVKKDLHHGTANEQAKAARRLEDIREGLEQASKNNLKKPWKTLNL